MLKKQKGYTLFELIFAIIGLAAIGGVIGLIYVAIHFIGKFW